MKHCLLLMTLSVTTGIQAQEVNDSTVKQQKLKEVVVTSSQSASKRMKEVQIGVEKIDINNLPNLPASAVNKMEIRFTAGRIVNLITTPVEIPYADDSYGE